MGAIIHRKSTIFKGRCYLRTNAVLFLLWRVSNVFVDDKLVISFDHLEELGQTFVQIKGFDRQTVAEAGAKLGFEVTTIRCMVNFVLMHFQGTYIQKSYIELYQEKYIKDTPQKREKRMLPSNASNDAQLNSFINAKL